MKTVNVMRAFVLILMLAAFSGYSVYASEPVKSPSDHLRKMINEGIKYPDKAVKNCCTGSVDVIFTVDEDGRILVEKTFAENAHVEKMVKDQLSSICCKGVKVPSYTHYKIKITFKLVG